MRVAPQDYWRNVFHDDPDCRGRCKRLEETIEIEDGSTLYAWECYLCGERVYAGLDAKRFVVHRPYPSERAHRPQEGTDAD